MTTPFLRTLSRSFVTASRHPFYSSISLTRSFAVPAAFADEEAEMVTFPREGSGVSYGLNWALAGRGVIVKDKAYYNLKKPELEKLGASKAEILSGLTLFMRGNTTGGTLDISKAQFGKLLKQVTSQISSVSSVFVQDGAISSSPKWDAKVRVISDSTSALLPLADILWKTPARAISHDSCPLTVYITSSISFKILENIGLDSNPDKNFVAADIERSSLILCGNAFCDVNIIKDALSALAVPIIFARGGLPLSARIIVSGNSVILLFAPEDAITNSSDLCGALLSMDARVVLSSNGISPFFQTKDPTLPNVLKRPSAIVFTTSDSTGALPLISKLLPEQAAYHYLAGYDEGKFSPAYIRGPSPLDPLSIANALHSNIKDSEIPTFLINVNHGGNIIKGKELLNLVESSLLSDLPTTQLMANDSKVCQLKQKYKSFLSGRFQGIPEEFSF